VSYFIPQERTMIYLKSFLAGTVTLLISALLIPGCMMVTAILFHKSSSAEGKRRAVVGWDVVSIMRNSLIPWLMMLVVFGAGFYWEFRSASH
jgi:hypothetical protein